MPMTVLWWICLLNSSLKSYYDRIEAMISRLFRNQNGRGDTFDLTPVMVMKIAYALEVGTVDALRSKDRTMLLNINLSEKGTPLYKADTAVQTGSGIFMSCVVPGCNFCNVLLTKILTAENAE